MCKKIKNSIILIITLTLFVGNVCYVNAKEVNTETKLQETKETINELVEAKDENSPFDISLRIKTFKRVVDLSISEAKDLKINLIAIEKLNQKLIDWRNNEINNLNKIIEYYEEKLKSVEDKEGSLKLEEIQDIATDFKNWREENYIPVKEKIQNLLLIKKEEKALEISSRRLEKISKDLNILKKTKIKNTGELNRMFKNANAFIQEAEKDNETALKILIERYASKEEAEKATSTLDTATTTVTKSENSNISTTTKDISTTTGNLITTSSTSTVENSSSTENDLSSSTEPISTSTVENINITTSTNNLTTSTLITTSSIKTITTTDSETDVIDPYQNVSIRDLISSSWNNIRSAYEIFIEMSDFVRKSLE
jgi:hypothetical protein